MATRSLYGSFVLALACGQRRGRVLLALLLMGLVAPFAQAQQFSFRQYAQQDGLSNLSVTALMQDRDGFIWVGTENGLFRQDSSGFKRFGNAEGFEGTFVHSILEDSAGRLWVGESHDLYVRDGERFRAVRPGGHQLNIDYGFRLLTPAKDRVWVLDNGGLLELWLQPGSTEWRSRPYFKAEQLQALPQLTQLSGGFIDPHGTLWLGCGHSLCRVSGEQVELFARNEGVPEDTWHQWLTDEQDRLWVRGQEHVVVLDRTSRAFEVRDDPHLRLTSGIMNVPMVRDHRGRILTRSNSGLMLWQADHWEKFNSENGVPEVSSLLVTREGQIWLGIFGHGLWQWLGYGQIESWNARAAGGGANPVWIPFRADDHTVLLGTRGGCIRLDERSKRTESCHISGLPAAELQVIARRGDSLWFGFVTGEVFRFAAGQKRAQLMGQLTPPRKLFVDRDNRLWLCGKTGIFMARAGSDVLQRMSIPSGMGEITDIAQDEEGVLWFAAQGGMLRWVDGQWSLLKIPLPLGVGYASIAPSHGGWLWVGGYSQGIVRMHVRGDAADEAKWIADPTVAGAAIYFTHVDQRGWLWVGTDNGLVLYDGHVWRRYTQHDGLIWNDMDENAQFADVDGSLWVGTSDGVSHLLQPGELIRDTPLRLTLTHARLSSIDLSSSRPSRVPWSQTAALDLRLSDLNFGDSHGSMLAVRLRGLSDEWFPSRDYTIHYPALAPGEYIFEAVVTDTDHQRRSPVLQLRFEILPPWWQRDSFRAFLGIMLCAGLALAWRWSMGRIERRRRALEIELREREQLLERATRDTLTRLWNRAAIMDILNREIDTARRSGTHLAVALIDIDHFKRINDGFGHLAGDEVLRMLGERLTREMRKGDSLGRYGGEELLLVVPGAPPQQPFLPMERLQRSIAAADFTYAGTRIRVTASFGVAWFMDLNEDGEKILARADKALYAAKFAGRDRIEYAATGS
jgi:diguanylate cyclase (GGDEF)-like protein